MVVVAKEVGIGREIARWRVAELHAVLNRTATRHWPHFTVSLAIIQVQAATALVLYDSVRIAGVPNCMHEVDSGSPYGHPRLAVDSRLKYLVGWPSSSS